ncbi:MAG: hypothetical protein ACOYI2_09980 [Bacillota bacterium]|jgi:uncharacterized protein (DUF362 family)
MIGKNGIRIIYGDNPKQMVKELLEVIKPEEEIDKNALIGIKPNLVVAKPSSSGATTSSEIVAGLIENFKNKQYDGLGIGACTSGFDKCVKGCPPKARDIVEYLESLI